MHIKLFEQLQDQFFATVTVDNYRSEGEGVDLKIFKSKDNLKKYILEFCEESLQFDVNYLKTLNLERLIETIDEHQFNNIDTIPTILYVYINLDVL